MFRLDQLAGAYSVYGTLKHALVALLLYESTKILSLCGISGLRHYRNGMMGWT